MIERGEFFARGPLPWQRDENFIAMAAEEALAVRLFAMSLITDWKLESTN